MLPIVNELNTVWIHTHIYTLCTAHSLCIFPFLFHSLYRTVCRYVNYIHMEYIPRSKRFVASNTLFLYPSLFCTQCIKRMWLSVYMCVCVFHFTICLTMYSSWSSGFCTHYIQLNSKLRVEKKHILFIFTLKQKKINHINKISRNDLISNIQKSKKKQKIIKKNSIESWENSKVFIKKSEFFF